ncbi:NAD(P)-binding protein [Annulohypoxylon maeteangense]|uniref:NAD(P)-binding protein n=1 Tax=Annulohypoxylon maeteangense TaxID=1927788 RepID=UPI00200775C7|nr:NAD(P)-binding protein [Annulohypoxylon maeteangense]KAI0880328.1 NAD(P)-binding protein [Annulohypoxylon maeteangense]
MAHVTLFGSRNKGGISFDPARDIKTLAGQVVLISGAAADLRGQTAIELARFGRPARIYCAAAFIAKEERLDTLVLNAGIIRIMPGTTNEGYEDHFGLNYFGDAFLSRLLMPIMLRTAQQEGPSMAPVEGIQFENLKTECTEMSYLQRYGQSKIARELTYRFPTLTAASVHPEVRNYLWAISSSEVVSGKYYEPVGTPDRETKMAQNTELSRKL